MSKTLIDRLENELSQYFPMVECIMGEPRRAAIAILKAMREPTESMLDAGEAAFSVPDAIGAGDAWQAMIDQAIKEGE